MSGKSSAVSMTNLVDLGCYSADFFVVRISSKFEQRKTVLLIITFHCRSGYIAISDGASQMRKKTDTLQIQPTYK